MKSSGLSMIGKLDNGLTRIIFVLVSWLKTGGLWLMGLHAFAFLIAYVFEYSEGLADISVLEWGLALMSALLLWRHIRYCQHFNTGFWSGSSRLLIFLGAFAAFQLIFLGIATLAALQAREVQGLLEALAMEAPPVKIFLVVYMLFAVYLAAPTAKKSGRTQKAINGSEETQMEQTQEPEESVPLSIEPSQ